MFKSEVSNTKSSSLIYPKNDVTTNDFCFQKLLIAVCNLVGSFLLSLLRHCFSLLRHCFSLPRQMASLCDAAEVTSSRTRRFD